MRHALLALAVSAFTLCATSAQAIDVNDRVIQKYQDVFAAAFENDPYMLEIRSGTSAVEYAVDSDGKTNPDQSFIDSADVIEISVKETDAGMVALRGVTIAYKIQPDDAGGNMVMKASQKNAPFSIRAAILETNSKGKYAGFRGNIEAAKDQWVALANMTRPTPSGDPSYVYILMRITDAPSFDDAEDEVTTVTPTPTKGEDAKTQSD